MSPNTSTRLLCCSPVKEANVFSNGTVTEEVYHISPITDAFAATVCSFPSAPINPDTSNSPSSTKSLVFHRFAIFYKHFMDDRFLRQQDDGDSTTQGLLGVLARLPQIQRSSLFAHTNPSCLIDMLRYNALHFVRLR